ARAQLEELGLLPSCDLERLAKKRLDLLGRSPAPVEENLRTDTMEIGVGVVLSLLLGLRDAELERPQGFVVAPELPERLREHEQHRGRAEPVAEPREVDERLLHLG